MLDRTVCIRDINKSTSFKLKYQLSQTDNVTTRGFTEQFTGQLSKSLADTLLWEVLIDESHKVVSDFNSVQEEQKAKRNLAVGPNARLSRQRKESRADVGLFKEPSSTFRHVKEAEFKVFREGKTPVFPA